MILEAEARAPLSPEMAQLAAETRKELSTPMKILSSFEDPLLKALETGGMRFLRASWLRRQGRGFRILRRQDLEALEVSGESPFLSAREAIILICRARRLVGILTYGKIDQRLKPTIEFLR